MIIPIIFGTAVAISGLKMWSSNQSVMGVLSRVTSKDRDLYTDGRGRLYIDRRIPVHEMKVADTQNIQHELLVDNYGYIYDDSFDKYIEQCKRKNEEYLKEAIKKNKRYSKYVDPYDGYVYSKNIETGEICLGIKRTLLGDSETEGEQYFKAVHRPIKRKNLFDDCVEYDSVSSNPSYYVQVDVSEYTQINTVLYNYDSNDNRWRDYKIAHDKYINPESVVYLNKDVSHSSYKGIAIKVEKDVRENIHDKIPVHTYVAFGKSYQCIDFINVTDQEDPDIIRIYDSELNDTGSSYYYGGKKEIEHTFRSRYFLSYENIYLKDYAHMRTEEKERHKNVMDKLWKIERYLRKDYLSEKGKSYSFKKWEKIIDTVDRLQNEEIAIHRFNINKIETKEEKARKKLEIRYKAERPKKSSNSFMGYGYGIDDDYSDMIVRSYMKDLICIDKRAYYFDLAEKALQKVKNEMYQDINPLDSMNIHVKEYTKNLYNISYLQEGKHRWCGRKIRSYGDIYVITDVNEADGILTIQNLVDDEIKEITYNKEDSTDKKLKANGYDFVLVNISDDIQSKYILNKSWLSSSEKSTRDYLMKRESESCYSVSNTIGRQKIRGVKRLKDKEEKIGIIKRIKNEINRLSELD